ncbi:hypothetical protein ABPG77_009138 [Micractinium sp. CCAP 211/92]
MSSPLSLHTHVRCAHIQSEMGSSHSALGLVAFPARGNSQLVWPAPGRAATQPSLIGFAEGGLLLTSCALLIRRSPAVAAGATKAAALPVTEKAAAVAAVAADRSTASWAGQASILHNF